MHQALSALKALKKRDVLLEDEMIGFSLLEAIPAHPKNRGTGNIDACQV
jgi:hypothetical protein